MRPLIYLDNGATSFPKAPGVPEAVAEFLRDHAGNPGRGGHRLTIAASRIIEQARDDVAALLGADPERTLLGSSSTFWLNTILSSCLHPGSRIMLSAMEHNAVMRPLRELEKDRKLELFFLKGDDATGLVSPDEIYSTSRRVRPDLVVLTHASNVNGVVFPVEEIAHRLDPIPVIVDGAQAAGSVPFDFSNSRIAAYVTSGHKGLLGPPGTGVLLLRDDFTIRPLVRGGTGSASESEHMPGFLPDLLEAGTPNGPGIAGLGAACRWLKDVGIDRVSRHENRLLADLATGLDRIKGVHLPGHDPHGRHTGVLSFFVKGMDTGELAHWLDREHGIAVRAGLHCAPAAHRRLRTFPEGTLRAGLGFFTTSDDIERLISAMVTAVEEGVT